MNRDHVEGCSGTTLVLAFAAGAAVGVVAALLLAPATGAETRRRVRHAAEEAASKARQVVRRGASAEREASEPEVVQALVEAG
jgi:gas vesicle protein